MSKLTWPEVFDGYRELISVYIDDFKRDRKILEESRREHEKTIAEFDRQCAELLEEKQLVWNKELKRRIFLLTKVKMYKDRGVQISAFSENLLRALREELEVD